MTDSPARRSTTLAFGGGAVIGAVGGLIGLGGAEFRLPLLMGPFRFAALDAVILNKAISLVVVVAALIFRLRTVPVEDVVSNWPTILNLLAGSVVGAWLAAGWVVQLESQMLHRVIAILLVVIGIVLLTGHPENQTPLMDAGPLRIVAGVFAGLLIGMVASFLGVAGGELLIPTLVLLFGADIKLAGSLSLAISLPTMIAGFVRYSRDQSFSVVRSNRSFLLVMAAGSIVGAFIGGMLLGYVPAAILIPLLSVILLLSAAKIWMHAKSATGDRTAQ